MLRVMQMTIAQSLLQLRLGRDWRFEPGRDLASGSVYLDIVSCFFDTAAAPLSLQNLVCAGQQLMGKAPSEWFGPTSAAKAVCHLFETQAGKSQELSGSMSPACLSRVGCATFAEGVIFKADVLRLFEEVNCEAAVILLCRRLGLDEFNATEYRESIEHCFSLPQFMGLASGNSVASAHFFVATHGESLLYLDPHTTHSSLNSMEEVQREAVAATLRPARPLPLRWSRLNPTVCASFLVHSREEFLALCDKLLSPPLSQVFEVLDKKPEFADRVEEFDGDMVLLE